MPVLIAGGGPVGLAVAALLARHGIASRVVEADAGYCTGSRAICLSRRSLEILDWCGAADAVVAKGLGWTSGRSFFRDEEVLRFEMPNASDDRFAPMTNIQQFHVEEALHRAALSHGGLAQVEWATTVEEVDRSARGIRLRCRRADGEPATFTGDWLVACDGGRSRVREALGLQLHGMTYEGRYVIVDIRQKSDSPTERRAWFDPPTNRGSTVLMHRQPDDVWRIDYQLREGEDPEQAVRPENVLPRVAAHLQWVGETEPWEVQWISIYNAKCLTLDAYRHGRVLFAGDAAHLVPIFGVRGLNSGLDDAGNLAWKLAAVARGDDEALLDTYADERRAAALVNIDFGSRSTEFMAPPHRGFALLREAVLRLAGSDPVIRNLINPRQTAPVPYDCPALQGPDEGFTSRLAAPGFVAPEAPLLRDGRAGHVTECFGHGFVVLAFDAGLAVRGADTVRIATDETLHAALVERYDAQPGTAYVIRPDGYVAARWKSARIADVQAALDRWSRDAIR